MIHSPKHYEYHYLCDSFIVYSKIFATMPAAVVYLNLPAWIKHTNAKRGF